MTGCKCFCGWVVNSVVVFFYFEVRCYCYVYMVSLCLYSVIVLFSVGCGLLCLRCIVIYLVVGYCYFESLLLGIF